MVEMQIQQQEQFPTQLPPVVAAAVVPSSSASSSSLELSPTIPSSSAVVVTTSAAFTTTTTSSANSNNNNNNDQNINNNSNNTKCSTSSNNNCNSNTMDYAVISTATTPSSSSPSSTTSALRCAICSFQGADLRLVGGCACAYHARCIDLVGLVNESRRLKQQQQQQQAMNIDTTDSRKDGNNNDVVDNNSKKSHEDTTNIVITVCPTCQRYDITGLEIVPLCFEELEKSRRQLSTAHAEILKKRGVGYEMTIIGGNSGIIGSNGNSNSSNNFGAVGAPAGSRSGSALVGGNKAEGNVADKTVATASSEFYDPSIPRTGRWTDEELAFRDALVTHFNAGSLPLSNGIKLNDFLSSMLRSKQSRLTKKMKHAKLSSNFYRILSGYVMKERDSSCGSGGGGGDGTGGGGGGACTFSNLECNFINSIPDPIERSEIAFHMQREWREHIAERLTYLRINFDATSWVRSVDAIDRRVALEKNRSRMAKRRCLMGKAMEKDVSENMPGVFINQRVDDFTEVVGSDMKVRRIDDYDISRVFEIQGGSDCRSASQAVLANGGVDTYTDGQHDEESELNRFLMSMLDEAPITTNTTMGAVQHNPHLEDECALVSSSLGGKKTNSILRSSCDPNFRHAAPFLAGITSYMERHAVPFEHIDIWVPSVVPPALESELSAPFIGSMGSGNNHAARSGGETRVNGSGGEDAGVLRLCFAGSATLGIQIVDESPSLDSSTMEEDTRMNENFSPETKTLPLTGDEIFNLSLFGQYSSKFSFSSGYGLPGRVFQSGIAAWEQFVANAPPEMFERRGGAVQFGIKTALGLPIECDTVGRIVLVLYSKHNREKDEELVNRIVKDVRLFNPCPRWKLVVDVGGAADPSRSVTQPPPQSLRTAGLIGGEDSAPAARTLTGANRSDEIMNLVTLLQEYMPFDQQSLLGAQLNSIMSLRMLLLRTRRTSEEEQLIDMMLVLFKSYIDAGRTREDIAKLLTRDYDFHMHQMTEQSQPRRNTSVGANSDVQQGSLFQLLSMNSFNQPPINRNNFNTDESPTTTAAPPGTFISSSFVPGNFPSTPFTTPFS